MSEFLDLKPMTERLLAQLDSKMPDCADDVMIEPAAVYTCPERFARERQNLFLGYPVFAGWSRQLNGSNTFLTLNVAGTELLLTRDKQGSLHAFKNACRHRGMPLTQEVSGCASRFTCPFHGWTYDSAGKLIGARRDFFPGIDAENYSLTRVPVAEKYGLMFVRAQGGEPIHLDDHLAGLQTDLAQFGWEGWECFEPRRREIAVNWKLILDGFCEGYHFNFIHRETLGSVVIPNTHVVDLYGNNLRECFGNQGLHDRRKLPAEQRGEPHMGADLAVIYLIFPNLIIIGFHSIGWQAISIWPGQEPGQTRVQEAGVFQPGISEAERQEVAARMTFNWESVIQNEDFAAALRIWWGIKSADIPDMVIGRNELPMQHFHRIQGRMAGGVGTTAFPAKGSPKATAATTAD